MHEKKTYSQAFNESSSYIYNSDTEMLYTEMLRIT